MPEFDLLETPELRALLQFVQLRLAKSPSAAAESHRQFEEELRTHTMAIERAVHGVDLERLDVDVPALLADGVRCRRVGRSAHTLLTMAGRVTINRTVYRGAGWSWGQDARIR